MAAVTRISFGGANGNSSSTEIDFIPDQCPKCHRGIVPVSVGTAFQATQVHDGFNLLQAAFRCTFHDCESMFIAQYLYHANTSKARFLRSVPESFIAREWDENIRKVSKDFVEIYAEASRAETLELTRIAGPGYRKALEYLIKDWLILHNPDDLEGIRTMFLGKCISKYMVGTRPGDIAKRAAWLGNDETHYYREWSDKDITDLKSLINLTAHWISMNEESDAVVKSMPEVDSKPSPTEDTK